MSDKQNDGCRFQLITFLLRRDKSAPYCCCKPFKLVKNLTMLKCSREVINMSIAQQQIVPDNWYQSILLISLPCNGVIRHPAILPPQHGFCSLSSTPRPLWASPCVWLLQLLHTFQPSPTNLALLLLIGAMVPPDTKKGQCSSHKTFSVYFFS